MGFVGDEDDIPFVHQKNKYNINTKFMINTLITISLVVFLVSIIRLYIKCLFRHRQAQGQATNYTIRGSQISNVTSVSQVEPPKHGLDPSIMTSLPIFLYKKSEQHTIECSICLSTIEDGELVRILPNCKHSFHVECIDKWFDCHSTCPVCRAEAKPHLSPEPREGIVGPISSSTPPMESGNLCITVNLEGTSSSGNGASSRLSSFKSIIILRRERSFQGLQAQSCSREDHVGDLESGGSRI
ncbi:RING-H2 finger protein ATL40 [Capsicum galapagoense]